MNLPKLYKIDTKGKLREWNIEAIDTSVVIVTGIVGGKLVESSYVAEPKNIGKANETTAEEQACLEATAKHTKQLKSGYFLSAEEAEASVFRKPVYLDNYNKKKDKLVYPCFIEPKMNGLRITILPDLTAIAKSGEPAVILPQWMPSLLQMQHLGLLEYGLDCEIWAGHDEEGNNKLELQDIVSAYRKENENTHLLDLYVFDLPMHTGTYRGRLSTIDGIRQELKHCEQYIGQPPYIKFSAPQVVSSEQEGDEFYKLFCKNYEGAVYRNFKGLYEWNKRSTDILKRKPRETMEVRVDAVSMDKKGQGLLHCTTEDGVNVKCLMKKEASKTVNYRLFDNAIELLDKFIVLEYEELSNDGVPTKPTGIAVREVNPNTWEAME